MRNVKEVFKSIIEKNLKSDNMLTTKSLRTYYGFLNSKIDNKKAPFYKYCTCDYYTLRNIEKSTLAVKKCTEFNDPYEGIALIKSETHRDNVEAIRDSALLTCFSEKKNDLIMFAHYADSYRGICIEYDLSLLDKDDYYKVNGNLVPVLYSKKPVILDMSADLKKYIEEYKEAARNGKICLSKIDDILSYFIHKPTAWGYEREWRLVFPIDTWEHALGIDVDYDKPVAILKNFDCISAIYLGVRIDEAKKEHIIEIVKRLNSGRRGRQPIKLFQTRMNDGKYKLESEQIKGVE